LNGERADEKARQPYREGSLGFCPGAKGKKEAKGTNNRSPTSNRMGSKIDLTPRVTDLESLRKYWRGKKNAVNRREKKGGTELQLKGCCS